MDKTYFKGLVKKRAIKQEDLLKAIDNHHLFKDDLEVFKQIVDKVRHMGLIGKKYKRYTPLSYAVIDEQHPYGPIPNEIIFCILDKTNDIEFNQLGYQSRHVLENLIMFKQNLNKELVDKFLERNIYLGHRRGEIIWRAVYRWGEKQTTLQEKPIVDFFINQLLKLPEPLSGHYVYALVLAVRLGYLNDNLFKNGAVNLRDYRNFTLLMYIAYNNSSKIPYVLKFKPDLNIQNDEGDTAGHFLIKTSNDCHMSRTREKLSEETLLIFLLNKPGVNISNKDGETLASLIFSKNYSPRIFKALIKLNPNMDFVHKLSKSANQFLKKYK